MEMILDRDLLGKLLAEEFENKTVAIVGNSPKILEYKNGSIIDSNDYVIRFNDSNTEGLEEFSGSKTNLRFIGFTASERHSDFFRKIKQENSLFLTKPKNKDFFRSLQRINRIDYFSYDIQKFALKELDRAFNTEYSKAYKTPPRSGLSLLIFITITMRINCKISIFGMDNTPKLTGKEHFYDDKRVFEKTLSTYNNFHCPIEHELEAFRFLLKSYPSLSFY